MVWVISYALDPPEPDANRARLYFQRGMLCRDYPDHQDEEAMAGFSEAIRPCPGQGGPYHLRATLHVRAGRLDAAAEDLRAAIARGAAARYDRYSDASAAKFVAE